jgi:hypothetical protein
VTISARREPSFDIGAQDRAYDGAYRGNVAAAPHAAGRASGLTRLVSMTQIVGSLLAVPLGLASGYSIYRANFSADTTCQNLRGNIITMLDKNVDAATRRMLVRRDVASFEKSCATVDPDATAAFKTLLAVDVAAAAPKPKPVTKAHAAAPAPEAARKVELRPALAEKQPVAAAAPVAESEAPPQEAVVSDAKWLAAVRQALETHPAEVTAHPEAARVAEPLLLQPDAANTGNKTGKPPAVLQPAWIVAAPPAAAPIAAPVAAPAAAARPLDTDHPVPPASIPAAQAAPEKHDSSTFGWMAQLPLIGPVIDRVRD